MSYAMDAAIRVPFVPAYPVTTVAGLLARATTVPA
jgi:hypothetical protein